MTTNSMDINGAALDVALMITATPADQPVFHEAKGKPVYYQAIAQSQITQTVITGKNWPAELRWTLPEKVEVAYPGFSRDKLTVSARVIGQPAIKLNTSVLSRQTRRWTVVVTVDPASQAAWTALGSKQRIEITTDYADLPIDMPLFEIEK